MIAMSEKPTSNRETKRVYITKYALTAGIEVRNAEVSEYGLWVKELHRHFHLGTDAFESQDEALLDAEMRRRKKIEGLQKQISKLEKLKVRTIDNAR